MDGLEEFNLIDSQKYGSPSIEVSLRGDLTPTDWKVYYNNELISEDRGDFKIKEVQKALLDFRFGPQGTFEQLTPSGKWRVIIDSPTVVKNENYGYFGSDDFWFNIPVPQKGGTPNNYENISSSVPALTIFSEQRVNKKNNYLFDIPDSTAYAVATIGFSSIGTEINTFIITDANTGNILKVVTGEVPDYEEDELTFDVPVGGQINVEVLYDDTNDYDDYSFIIMVTTTNLETKKIIANP